MASTHLVRDKHDGDRDATFTLGTEMSVCEAIEPAREASFGMAINEVMAGLWESSPVASPTIPLRWLGPHKERSSRARFSHQCLLDLGHKEAEFRMEAHLADLDYRRGVATLDLS